MITEYQRKFFTEEWKVKGNVEDWEKDDYKIFKKTSELCMLEDGGRKHRADKSGGVL
jgi:hypothetical protein